LRSSFFTTLFKKQDFFGSATNFALAALPKWIKENGSAAIIGPACRGRRPRQQLEENIMTLQTQAPVDGASGPMARYSGESFLF